MPLSVRIIKRIFDVILSVIGILVTAPLFPIIALAIKLDSKGPVFFRQERVGLDMPEIKNTFRMVKFRTMYEDAESRTGPVWATDNDPRITRVGKVLRKARLDEFPQLYNVLWGDMSLIGPRPERPHFVDELDKSIPYYTERVTGIKPGITGLAQINCAYDTSVDSVKEKLYYDHAYAARLTSFKEFLITDLYITFMTFWVMVKGKGAK
jgi:lipopolysaccharide/colanic/teichoic acid biosynthesis glycosyltransferase